MDIIKKILDGRILAKSQKPAEEYNASYKRRFEKLTNPLCQSAFIADHHSLYGNRDYLVTPYN